MAIGTRSATAVAVLLLPLAVAVAQTCNDSTPDDAPTARYQPNGDGTASDLHTGLMWMRCALGQSWDASNADCTGDASTFTWQEALQAAQSLDQNGGFAGYTDWRLPTVRELMSIARFHCYDPAINLTVFPATPDGPFWSSTPLGATGDFEWELDFSTGQATFTTLTTTFPIRLVRAGAFFP